MKYALKIVKYIPKPVKCRNTCAKNVACIFTTLRIIFCAYLACNTINRKKYENAYKSEFKLLCKDILCIRG